LEWNFKFRSASDIRRIVLFSYGLRSKAKTTIASRVIKSGIFQYNPHIPERQKLFVCEISLKEDGIGKASISILNVQFDHTYDYGISVKMTDLAPAENVVSLKVVGRWICNITKVLLRVESIAIIQPIRQRVNNYILIFTVSQSVWKQFPTRIFAYLIDTNIGIRLYIVHFFIKNLSMSFLHDSDNRQFIFHMKLIDITNNLKGIRITV
jgi:hypothetical protein